MTDNLLDDPDCKLTACLNCGAILGEEEDTCVHCGAQDAIYVESAIALLMVFQEAGMFNIDTGEVLIPVWEDEDVIPEGEKIH